MRVKLFVCAALVVGATNAFAVDPTGAIATFTVTEQTKVPGETLKPGEYTIRVVDHLSDRLIVRVDSANGKTHSTFLGLQDPSVNRPASPGVITWENAAQKTTYLKGFLFPNTNSVVEFVYPKAEAVAIAKSNQSKVPAIDPASEGKVADKSLSRDDMEVVTLWLLSSTTVGPSDSVPAIKAEKYQQVAGNEPPPQPAEQLQQSRQAAPVTSNTNSSVSPAPTTAAASTPVRQPRPHKPVVAALPHTGSFMPLVWLVGLLSLFGALATRLVRLGQTSQR